MSAVAGAQPVRLVVRRRGEEWSGDLGRASSSARHDRRHANMSVSGGAGPGRAADRSGTRRQPRTGRGGEGRGGKGREGEPLEAVAYETYGPARVPRTARPATPAPQPHQ